ncbi:MAG TPA: site-specific integrase, partial [Nitrospinota bacterium]|nr:site-specific integrase [Nitrospinota bacterium]
GFFEYEEYQKMREALPDYLRPVLTMGYYSACRIEEILSLKWDQVDLLEKKIELEVGTTKNKEPRILYMDGELFEIIKFQLYARNTKFPECPWVFSSRKGRQIRNYRKAWNKARDAAELHGKIFHDLRRTAARNMRKAGVSESVIMKIGGWKTRSVFERYNIIDEEDLKEASKRLTDYHKTKNSINLVITREKEKKERDAKAFQVLDS